MIKKILFLLLVFTITSCITEDKVGYYLYKHPEKLDKFCPQIDTVFKVDSFIKIDTFIKIEYDSDNSITELILYNDKLTLQEKLDSISKIKQKTITKYIKTIDYRRDTVAIYIYKTKPNIIQKQPTNKGFFYFGFWVSSSIALILLIVLVIFYFIIKWTSQPLQK